MTEENTGVFESLLCLGLNIEPELTTFAELVSMDLEQIGILSVMPKNTVLSDFLENIKFWAFPHGLRIFDEFLNEIGQKSGLPPPEKIEELEIIEQFVITDANSVKRFCSSLVFYEKQYVQSPITSSKSVLPKVSLEALIRNPLAERSSGYTLVLVPKALSLISQMPVFSLQLECLELLYHRVLKPRRDPRENSERVFHLGGKHRVKESRLFEFYTQILLSQFTIGENDLRVAFLGLDPEGTKPLLEFHINNSIGLNVPTFDFFMLFELLDIDNLLTVFAGVLLEKQIVMFGGSSRQLTNCAETLLSLINPLTWGCIYIPYLPLELWETLHAMMPYIIGLDIGNRKELQRKMKLSDKLVVDLSGNTVENSNGIQLPRAIYNFLQKNLEEILKLGRSLETVLRIKQIFLDAMFLIINNIEGFFFNRESEVFSAGPSSEVFNFFSFLDCFREDFETFEFMEVLCLNTMMFNKFIEDCDLARMSPYGAIEDDNQYFLNEIKKIRRKYPELCVFDIEKTPGLFKELMAEQKVVIDELLDRFEGLGPELKPLLPFYLKFRESKKGKLEKSLDTSLEKSQKNKFFSKLNRSLEAIPRFSGEFQVLKSPVAPKNLRKKQVLHRLASYEHIEGRDGSSPSSKLISKIKSYYFYYHAIKRNQTYNNYKRFTNKRKKFSEIVAEKHNVSEKMTPFFRDIGETQEVDKMPEVNRRLFEDGDFLDSAKKEIKANFIHLKPINIVNPQDSSCEVTPCTDLKKEPENFSQWLMNNSMKNVGRWDKFKEDLRDKEIKRFGTRSLSPKKKKKAK